MADEQPQFDLELPTPRRAPRRATKAQSAPDTAAIDQMIDLSDAIAAHGQKTGGSARSTARRKTTTTAKAPTKRPSKAADATAGPGDSPAATAEQPAPTGADAATEPAGKAPTGRKRSSSGGAKKSGAAAEAAKAGDSPAAEQSSPSASEAAPSGTATGGSKTDPAKPTRSSRTAKGSKPATASQPASSSTADPAAAAPVSARPPMTALLFQAPVTLSPPPRRREEPAPKPAETEPAEPKATKPAKKRRATAPTEAPAETKAAPAASAPDKSAGQADEEDDSGSKRRRRRARSGRKTDTQGSEDSQGVSAVSGSTRLEAKRQRRKESREVGRRRTQITEAEFLAHREEVDRRMVVRERDAHTQIAVLEDGVLVEHYVARHAQHSMVGNVYLGRVQNVLPSMEAAFVDIGKGRNAILYAGEVNWDAAGLEGQPRRIEQALASGDSVMVQVTKDPIGHKGARLTSQITLAGRYLVLVPGGGMTGISRKLPEAERSRLKKLLKEIVPEDTGVIVRTAAAGGSDADLTADVERLAASWAKIQAKAATASAPSLLKGEPDLAIRVVRD
ncbi:MAG: ribonuclease E/G, partial [Bifidobacteriaceae bacterium]|nr:ribonuclease E/G [Bifidobacteriaceae bacterium]